jgi:hypothetical protein
MLCSSERRRRFSALQTAGRAVAMARGSSFGKIAILDVGPGPAYACTSPHEVDAGDRDARSVIREQRLQLRGGSLSGRVEAPPACSPPGVADAEQRFYERTAELLHIGEAQG